MSFQPNNFQTGTTNAFFPMPTPPNLPQQHGNTKPTDFNKSADAVNSNANWFNQQNWQQQQNSQIQPQVDSQPQHFFDTIPSNQSYQQQSQQPPQAAKKLLGPQGQITGDGWEDWDDWNQNESKALPTNDNLKQNVSQGDPAQQTQNILGDSFQRNDNWQWQNNQSISSSHQLNQQSFQTQHNLNWQSAQDSSTSTATTAATSATPQFQPVQRSVHEVKPVQTLFQPELAVPGPLTSDTSTPLSTPLPQFQQSLTGASPSVTIPTSYFNVESTRSNPVAIGTSSTPTFLPVSSVNTDPKNVPTTSIPPPPSSNWQNVKEQTIGFRRSGQIQRATVKIASTSAYPLTSTMDPSTIPPPISENQDLPIPENYEVFENSGQSSRMSLPNVSQNVGETAAFIPPAPQLFENPSDELAFNVPVQSILKPPINVPLRPQNNLPDGIKTLGSRPQVSITAPISRSQTNMEASTVHLPAIHSLEDRERFLNQENVANERDRFINQTEGTDNLLPPPIAYQQPTPNDDRNQYLQTSHLSEDDFVVLNNPSNDEDVNLPPPGLSRFVLGEPEQTGDNERHADGEDDDAIQPPPTSISSDINRNMYPFSSHMDQVQRVVTGVESMTISQPLNMNPQQVESREIDLDGENIEDQQQAAAAAPKQHREEPTIGGDPSSNEPELNPAASINVPDSKNLSNSSTGNDSDHHNRNSNRKYSSRSGKNRKRYDSDDSEGSSERDRQRHKDKERKRKDHGQNSDDGDSYRQKNVKGRDDKHRHNMSRYDDSRYETEESSRYDRSGRRQDRRDRDRKYDEEIKRGGNHRRSYRGERPERRGGDGDRERRDNRDRSDREDNRDRRRRTTEQKHRNYDDNYQNYNRKSNSSRNARDSDYEKDSRYRRYNLYGGYEYDPYAYYHQHQQYFEQLRRTNPQSYAEWYRKYYSQMQGDSLGGTDCRESVHSGRSSAAGHVNDKDRPENMSNLEERSVGQEDPNENIQPGRLTPYKFSNDHVVLSLVSGILVCGKPKYSHSNGLQNIVKLINISPNDSTKKLFQAFPGPLVKGITHKKTVIEYCEERIKHGPHSSSNRMRSCQGSSNSLQSLTSSQQASQSSYVLLWNLLILLLRQNGVVVGTDIAELLVKNQKLFPYEISSKRNSINSIEKEVKGSNESNTSEVEDNDLNDSNDSSDDKEQLNDEQITDKFRNYLLYGNVKDALEWATDNNLWGHALFLASKVDRRLHANVMMKFANKLQLNDPLQTLYQLMSGRCPSSVTSVQDEKWGDWRPHLAMIISNTTQSPDLNRKAITSLGDSLINRGDLFAGQFCYLMSQVGFGKYASASDSVTSANMVRLVLLGSSHIKANSFLEFASNDAIIMTEIYEYACSLNDERFSIVEFQPYKFLLACRLLDYGFHLKAFMYLEQISIHVQKDSSRYEPLFVERVYNLADKLKFYDPVMEKTYGDGNEVQFEDQEWLKNLRILQEQNALSSGNGHYNQQYQQSFEHNNFETNLNTIPENGGVQESQGMVAQSESQYQNHYHQQEPPSITNEVFQGDTYGNFYQPTPQQQPEISDDTKKQHLQQQHQQFSQQTTYSQQEPFLTESTQSNYSAGYDYYNQNPTPEAFSQQHEQTAALVPSPSISMPNTGSGPKRSIFDEEDNGLSQQQKIGGATEVKKEETKKSTQQQKQSSSSSQNTGWFGGIFNKFSVKPKNQMILPDDKNPTIVWDAEKKKWINTDEGEESQENFAPPPKISNFAPQLQQIDQQQPLQNQLQTVPQFIQPQSATMQSSGGITDPMAAIPSADPQVQAQLKSSGLQSNMFKMQRNRTLKKSYVDVFNPSGVSTKPSESILAPSLPPLPQTGFMVPGGPAGQPQQSSQGAAAAAAAQFYDPNAYGANLNQ